MTAIILLIIGLIIIITPISITFWCFIRLKPYAKSMISVCLIFVFIGLALVFFDRITEITVEHVGTIKAATKQVTLDAKEVSKLKERIEAQSATIDLVAQNASEAKTLSKDAKSLYEELSNKNKIADKELKNISDKILPLELKAKSLSSLIRKSRKEISHLQELLNIQQLMIASIAGSRPDYEKLTNIAGKKSSLQPFANDALRDIFFYFDSQKNTEGRLLGDFVSKKFIEYSVDEVISVYHTEDPKRDVQESAINTLAILKRDTAVQEICDSIDKEQNLRVISRMTRTLEILTGEKFYPLDIDAVKTWWGKNRDQEKYKPCYKGLLEALAIQEKPSFGSNENDYKQVVSLLKQTIDADPDALYSRCLLGFYYTLLKDKDNAEKEFKEVENLSKNNYRWLFFYKAVFFLFQDDINSAIKSLNRAMEISPVFETKIKTSPIFKNLLENPQLKFPSNKII